MREIEKRRERDTHTRKYARGWQLQCKATDPECWEAASSFSSADPLTLCSEALAEAGECCSCGLVCSFLASCPSGPSAPSSFPPSFLNHDPRLDPRPDTCVDMLLNIFILVGFSRRPRGESEGDATLVSGQLRWRADTNVSTSLFHVRH